MTALAEMPCREFVERVTDYLEGALDDEDCCRLEEHLDACRHCALYLEQLRTTLALTGRLREDDVTPVMRTHLLRTFTAWRDAG